MKRILCFAVAVFAICLLTTFTYAQSESLKLRFNIPFAFTVENTTFAAGEYEITEPSHLLLELRNVESQAAAFEHAQPARTKKEANGRVRLIFHRFGREYFLVAVSDGSWPSTYDLRPSKQEQALASPTAQPKIVSVLVDGSIETANTGKK